MQKTRQEAARKTRKNEAGKKETMKTCENCGARYEEALDQCPYCGAQNVRAAWDRYQHKVKELGKEKREIRELPRTIPQKVSKKVIRAAGLFILLFLIAALAVTAGAGIKARLQKKNEQKHIEVMEELLLKRDYEALSDYYRSLDYAYVVYDKYQEVSRVYEQYKLLKDRVELIKDMPASLYDQYYEEDLQLLKEQWEVFEELAVSFETDRMLMSNEKQIGEIRQAGQTLIEENFAKILEEGETGR